jgi:hypothetical protein
LIYRIYTVSAEGCATLQSELRGLTEKAALRSVLSLLQSLPTEATWLMECDREGAPDLESSKPH